MDFQRQMLQELMNPLIPQRKIPFTDPEVCKNFLCGFCPNELFQNTKVDLGKCNLIHDSKLQKEYQKQPKRLYEAAFYEMLNRMMQNVERTIRKAYQRLDHKSDAVYENVDLVKEQIWEFEERIEPEIPVVYEIAQTGKIAEAFDYYSQVLKIHEQLEQVRQSDPTHHTYRPDRRMEVCDVCGSLLANDATGVRIDAHMVGKQHQGFLKIKFALEEQKRKLAKEKRRKDLMDKAQSRARRKFE